MTFGRKRRRLLGKFNNQKYDADAHVVAMRQLELMRSLALAEPHECSIVSRSAMIVLRRAVFGLPLFRFLTGVMSELLGILKM